MWCSLAGRNDTQCIGPGGAVIVLPWNMCGSLGIVADKHEPLC